MFVRRQTSGRKTCLIVAAIVAATMIAACIILALALSFFTLPSDDSEESADTPSATRATASATEGQRLVEETIISILDVDQGQAVLVVAEDGSAALIDSGRSQTRIREEIEPYVRSLGVERLDYLILSHPDQDHVGGMPQVLESFTVDAWVDPGIPTTNQTYEESVEIVLDRNIPAILARRGETLTLGASTTLTLLWPEDDFILDGDEPDSNENSVVVLITVGDVSILVPGDLEDEGEQALFELLGTELESEFLVVGHHGSNSSSTPEFLNAVNAEVAIISAGADNPYGHPHDEVLQRLRFRDTDIYRTDLDGTIEIHVDVDGDSYTIETIETDLGT